MEHVCSFSVKKYFIGHVICVTFECQIKLADDSDHFASFYAWLMC
jgi:hypothetical protein